MSVDDDTVLHRGTHTFLKKPAFPAGSFGDSDVIANAGIKASKLQHQYPISRELFAPATAVAALTQVLGSIQGATGSVYQVEASIYVQATGADRTVHVDIQKSTGGGAFATIMTATVSITNGTVIFTPVEGTVDGTLGALVDGDLLQAVVTVAGSAGNQAKGLSISVWIVEDAA